MVVSGEFIKYQERGAYHWIQADPRWTNRAFNAPLHARYQVLASQLRNTRGVVLDLGCGDGYLMHLICDPDSRSVHGLDASLLGVELARTKLLGDVGGWSLAAGDSIELPIRDGSVDAVTFADVIEHLDEPARALREIARVLRDDGRLMLSTPNRNPARVWDPLHAHEFDAGELRSLVGQFFEEVDLFGCWPMRWFNRWTRNRMWRLGISALARLGYNPFCQLTDQPSEDYGQLVCVAARPRRARQNDQS